MTPLHSVLKRAVNIGGREYALTLTPEHLRLTLKGKRNGIELAWTDLVSGEAALAIALRASVGAIKPEQVKQAGPLRAKQPAKVRTARRATRIKN